MEVEFRSQPMGEYAKVQESAPQETAPGRAGNSEARAESSAETSSGRRPDGNAALEETGDTETSVVDPGSPPPSAAEVERAHTGQDIEDLLGKVEQCEENFWIFKDDGSEKAAAEIDRLGSVSQAAYQAVLDAVSRLVRAKEEAERKGLDHYSDFLNARQNMRTLQAEVARLRAGLQSIANNTCCEGCQEAALVARAALKGGPA